MSENYKTSNKESEEIDLISFFKLLKGTIISPIRKLVLFFIWIVFFIKRHSIKFLIAGGLGLCVSFIIEKTIPNAFYSQVTIKQNHDIGDIMYNTIAYYNELIENREYKKLGHILNAEDHLIEGTISFSIEPIINENNTIRQYSQYIKIDTTLIKDYVDYESYLDNMKDYNYTFQRIIIYSKEKYDYGNLLQKIIFNITELPYVKRGQEKDLDELHSKAQMYKETLAKSDSLKNMYKRILEFNAKHNLKSKKQLDIIFDNNRNESTTREFDLFEKDIVIKNKLIQNKKSQADKKYVIEIIDSKVNMLQKHKRFFGHSLKPKIYYSIIMVMLTFTVLVTSEVLKKMEAYKQKYD